MLEGEKSEKIIPLTKTTFSNIIVIIQDRHKIDGLYIDCHEWSAIMDNNKDVLLRFKESWRRIDKMCDTYAKSVGLNFIEILVLEILCEPGPHTQKALCTKLELPKQFINTIINSFREDSLVTLKEANDRRNKEILLTEKGKQFAEKVVIPLQEMEESAMESFTAEELHYCTALSEKYEKSFETLLNEFINKHTGD